MDTTEVVRLARKACLTTTIVEKWLHDADDSQASFLAGLLTDEVDSRARSHVQRLLTQACFPAVKTFAGYDFTHVHLPEGLTREDLAKAGFVAAHENLILMGPVGTGKTHLATAIGVNACHLGLKVRFASVAHLVLTLAQASKAARLDQEMTRLARLDLLILDELGYIPIDLDQARMLFQVIADAYEATSLIVTTNLEFSRWGQILADTQMAAALIERVVHHGHLITFEGTSWRLDHSLIKKEQSTMN